MWHGWWLFSCTFCYSIDKKSWSMATELELSCWPGQNHVSKAILCATEHWGHFAEVNMWFHRYIIVSMHLFLNSRIQILAVYIHDPIILVITRMNSKYFLSFCRRHMLKKCTKLYLMQHIWCNASFYLQNVL